MGKLKLGLLAGAFAAVVGIGGWTAHGQMAQSAKTAVEEAGYTGVSVSEIWMKPGGGCSLRSERFAFTFKAAAADGKAASGVVCVTGVHRTATRVLPNKPPS